MGSVVSRAPVISAACPYFGTRYRSIDYLLEFVDEAGRRRSDLLVLPELRFLDAPTTLERLRERAAAHRMHVVVGLRERLPNGKQRAVAYLLDRSGRVAGTALQTHAMPEEDLVVGDEIAVVQTDMGTLGMTVGTDALYFEPYEVLARKGARIVTWSSYPEAIRDVHTDDVRWRARALDFNVTLALAGWADDLPFFPQGCESGVPGSPPGRSRVMDHAGVALADTGYDSGLATAHLEPERRKRRVRDDRTRQGLPSYGRPGEPAWLLGYFSSRASFRPIAEPAASPLPRPRGERLARVCVQGLRPANLWQNDRVPEVLLAKIEAARPFRPDLVVCSEQATDRSNPVTAQGLTRVAELARSLGSYVVVAGIRPGTHPSTALVWDRRGEIVAERVISWTGEARELRVVETDFGILGIRICGDTEFPEIDRILALQGAEIIVDPSQMWAPGGANLELLARARAIDNGVYVVCSHWSRSDPSLRSFVIDPYGMVLASTRHAEDDVAFAELRLGCERRRYVGDPEDSLPADTEDYIECYKARKLAAAREDYWAALFAGRRPELYGVIAEEDELSRSGPSRG
jgi:predicted amidohydrolase